MGEKWPMNFAWKCPTSTVTFRDLLHAVNLWKGKDGFTSSPKEGVLRIFFALKNPAASAGFETSNLGAKGQLATSRPQKVLRLKILNSRSYLCEFDERIARRGRLHYHDCMTERPCNCRRLQSCTSNVPAAERSKHFRVSDLQAPVFYLPFITFYCSLRSSLFRSASNVSFLSRCIS